MKRTSHFFGVIFFLGMVSVWGADQDTAARNWAASCTGCHGTNGHSEGGIPTLAGLDKAYIFTAMVEFKSGKRPATVMHQHAKGYTDEQLERIAGFFAAQHRR